MDNDNNSYLMAFILFLLLLFVTAVIIAAIILFLPRQNVALFGACTEQSECEVGLICYGRGGATDATGGRCLGGLGYTCSVNSDCANGFICLENSSTLTKMCSLPITLGQVNVQPVITSLVLPTNIPTITNATPINLTSNNVTSTNIIPTTRTAAARVACPSAQSILTQVFPQYNQVTTSRSVGACGNNNAYRTFTPMNISIAKKKL